VPRRTLTLATALAVVVGLVIAGFTLPVPYVTLVPGPVYNTLGAAPSSDKPLIKVTGRKSYRPSGHLDLVTVAVTDPDNSPTLFGAIAAWLDPHKAIVPEQVLYPPNENPHQVSAEQAQEMDTSQNHAVVAALHHLDIPVHTVVAVGHISPHTPAAKVLKQGDAILAVDGKHVASAAALRKAIGSRKPGQAVHLTIRRGGHRRILTVHTVSASATSKRAIVGFIPTMRPEAPFRIRFGLRGVGGPSAGLMYTLGIIDKLTPGDLTHGKFVAGTGTISTSGKVGRIGGIQQKVVAAHRNGATIFITPAPNCAAAKSSAPHGLRLVKVRTLGDALSALHNLGRKGGSVPSC
jgi:PDZ domain-containing protein